MTMIFELWLECGEHRDNEFFVMHIIIYTKCAHSQIDDIKSVTSLLTLKSLSIMQLHLEKSGNCVIEKLLFKYIWKHDM